MRRVDEFVCVGVAGARTRGGLTRAARRHPVFFGGARLCLGHEMARVEFMFAAKAILQDFDVSVVPGQTFKAVNGPVVFWESGVKAVVKPRKRA